MARFNGLRLKLKICKAPANPKAEDQIPQIVVENTWDQWDMIHATAVLQSWGTIGACLTRRDAVPGISRHLRQQIYRVLTSVNFISKCTHTSSRPRGLWVLYLNESRVFLSVYLFVQFRGRLPGSLYLEPADPAVRFIYRFAKIKVVFEFRSLFWAVSFADREQERNW